MKQENRILLLLVATIITCLFVTCAAIVFQWWLFTKSGSGDVERIRENAASLEARGLFKASLDELDRFREDSRGTLSKKEEADLLYKMGKMADEKLGDCDRALAYYTMATAMDPDAEWKNDAGKGSVVCMEKLGDKKQAQALLLELTGGEPPSAPPADSAPRSPVVAVVDNRDITWAEVMAHLEGRAQKDKLGESEYRNQLVQQYVFTLMLSEEAAKKGYEQDPEVQAAVEQARREAVAAAYLQKEIPDRENKDAMKKLWEDLVKLHEARIYQANVPDEK